MKGGLTSDRNIKHSMYYVESTFYQISLHNNLETDTDSEWADKETTGVLLLSKGVQGDLCFTCTRCTSWSIYSHSIHQL